MPATGAFRERSFSASKRVKTYFRSITGDSRLNHVMTLHVHKDRTDALTPVDVANDFVENWGERKPKAIVWQIFRERYPKQILYFVKVNTNGKLETRTKGIVDKCSDLTCTKKYALTERPKHEGGREVNVGHSLSPPSHFMLATGLKSCSWKRNYPAIN